jgi:hypothetical protein
MLPSAQADGVSDAQALTTAIDAKSREFRQRGREIYIPVKPLPYLLY